MNFSKKFLKHTYRVTLHAFAIIGLIFVAVFFGMQYGLFNVKGSIATRNHFFENASTTQDLVAIDQNSCIDHNKRVCAWNETHEWNVIKAGLQKDQLVINRVAQETGVSPRLIAATAVPEQIRFFSSSRDVFKRYFEPLKILGSLSQFSLGVSGIKPETATLIEEHLVASSSPYYLGPAYEKILLYATSTHSSEEQYARLTNEKDHYYSFLYTALFLKQIVRQWDANGTSINNNPGVLITLFNLGFSKSVPKANPSVGGAFITIGGTTYTYGELGELFFNSQELKDIFPN